ncbi:hypothetical protein J6Z39_09145 [bacterium]|nr:hypothetical protein [bacterium]MBP5435969.1 hypothetical protein [bacterium]
MRRAEGYIKDIDPEKMQAKVRLPQQGDFVTDWLQIGFVGPDSDYCYRKGDYVALIMDDTFDDGWILCRLYPEDVKLDGEKVTTFKFRDGTELKISEEQSRVTLTVGEAAKIEITQQGINIIGSSVTISGTGESGINSAQSVVHAMSPCPVFGTCHMLPSVMVKVSQ